MENDVRWSRCQMVDDLTSDGGCRQMVDDVRCGMSPMLDVVRWMLDDVR